MGRDREVLFQVEKWVEIYNLLWGNELYGTFPLFHFSWVVMGLTGVKGNGKVVRGLRGVFPPPRRCHFPTGGGCTCHNRHLAKLPFSQIAKSPFCQITKLPNIQITKLVFSQITKSSNCHSAKLPSTRIKKIGTDNRRRFLRPKGSLDPLGPQSSSP